jgi:hypothetical protein
LMVDAAVASVSWARTRMWSHQKGWGPVADEGDSAARATALAIAVR